jgi:hypothetical protein
MARCWYLFVGIALLGGGLLVPLLSAGRAEQPAGIAVQETEDWIQIDTDAPQARIRKKGYVSGIERGTFLDKKTGAREVGFGLHIMDFLMASAGERMDIPTIRESTVTYPSTTSKDPRSVRRPKNSSRK